MLTTTCTQCRTEFRITREQLTVRAGQVRCGQCRNVFDALATLRNNDIEAELPRDSSHSSIAESESVSNWPALDDAGQPSRENATQVMETAAAAPAFPLSAAPATPVIAGDGETAARANDAIAHTAPPHEVAAKDAESSRETLPAAAARRSAQIFEPDPIANTPAEAGKTENVSNTAESAAARAPSFDFGPKARPKRGWWWVPLGFLLFLGLAGQGAYYFRGAIALLVPELKPYIVEICAELGCDVPLPKRVELLGIESSDLQADPARPGVMVLSATLRNRAAFPQAFPALELTLTNERDMALARRVLQPADYLPETLEAFEGSSERPLRLSIEAGALKASGYRLYLFYP